MRGRMWESELWTTFSASSSLPNGLYTRTDEAVHVAILPVFSSNATATRGLWSSS